ncbi:hypothetical protein [Pseudoclavibacter helvolus]|uniref:hypothetical protein n=1 Tax=Pseudoclavibacter helvolus TaxID=255205 RepID=UPI003C788104
MHGTAGFGFYISEAMARTNRAVAERDRGHADPHGLASSSGAATETRPGGVLVMARLVSADPLDEARDYAEALRTDLVRVDTYGHPAAIAGGAFFTSAETVRGHTVAQLVITPVHNTSLSLWTRAGATLVTTVLADSHGTHAVIETAGGRKIEIWQPPAAPAAGAP